MIKLIVSIWKVFLKLFTPGVFIVKAIGALFAAKGNSSVNEGIGKALGAITSLIDVLGPIMIDKDLVKIKVAINDNVQKLNNFVAIIVPDKHGPGNAGIEVKYIDGPTTLSFDPSDGNVKVVYNIFDKGTSLTYDSKDGSISGNINISL